MSRKSVHRYSAHEDRTLCLTKLGGSVVSAFCPGPMPAASRRFSPLLVRAARMLNQTMTTPAPSDAGKAKLLRISHTCFWQSGAHPPDQQPSGAGSSDRGGYFFQFVLMQRSKSVYRNRISPRLRLGMFQIDIVQHLVGLKCLENVLRCLRFFILLFQTTQE